MKKREMIETMYDIYCAAKEAVDNSGCLTNAEFDYLQGLTTNTALIAARLVKEIRKEKKL